MCSSVAWQAHGELNSYSRDSNQKAREAQLSKKWSKKGNILGTYLENERIKRTYTPFFDLDNHRCSSGFITLGVCPH
ncbi:hypothetical protein [Vibrio tapetis]|uniref:Uncharacterized protein n=1 Tax=Vibrio tapetis subsp. tapetis TaxID=1671868 RepID=A0A2N8ZKV7_9VIBR|nr:hypothetical protein [Vibrio tapetis]SON52543.1 protein of unknown function [Vibrio tapetis subsp. tapetis]